MLFSYRSILQKLNRSPKWQLLGKFDSANYKNSMFCNCTFPKSTYAQESTHFKLSHFGSMVKVNLKQTSIGILTIKQTSYRDISRSTGKICIGYSSKYIWYFIVIITCRCSRWISLNVLNVNYTYYNHLNIYENQLNVIIGTCMVGIVTNDLVTPVQVININKLLRKKLIILQDG